MSSQQEEYLDGLLNSMQDETTPSLQNRFQDFDLDIVSELSRDKDLEWESKAGNQNREENVATEDVINASLDNLLAEKEDDPNKSLSADEIAALFAQANLTEETSAPEEIVPEPEPVLEEEPVIPEIVPVSDDPNKSLSADEIAALFAQANVQPEPDLPGEEEELPPEPEEILEQEPEEPHIEPVSDDPNKSLSADEIAALFAQAGVTNAVTTPEPEKEPVSDETASGDDEMMQMSQEEIASLISAANAQAEAQENLSDDSDSIDDQYGIENGMGDAFLDDILREFDGDKDLEEIQSMLQKSESGEKIETSEPQGNFWEEEVKSKAEKAKEEREKEKKQEKKQEKRKKKGFFEKLFELITEEVEEEEPKQEQGLEINLSDENAEILAQIEERPARQAKKERGKKSKKGKDTPKEKTKKEKAKKEKPPKPKKEKKPKEKAKPDPHRKPFSKKLLFAVAILAATIFAGIYLVSVNYPRIKSLNVARKAFYNQDYKAAYYEFYGKKLKESDQVLFNQSYAILKMQHRLDAYESYERLGMRLEAIDALMQGVAQYNELYDYASTIGSTSEVERIYQEILTKLQDVYGLNETQISEIVNEKNDLCYTLRLKAVLDGKEYVDPYENLEYYLGEMETESVIPEAMQNDSFNQDVTANEVGLLEEEQYIAE